MLINDNQYLTIIALDKINFFFNNSPDFTDRYVFMNSKIIVIDDGSNYLKASFLNNSGELITSSVASRVIRNALPSLDGKNYSANSFKVGNNFYSVSSCATSVIPTNNAGYQFSEHNRVLVHNVLKNVVNASSIIDVVVTLPIGTYFNADGSQNETAINDKVSNVKGSIEYLDNTDSIKIDGCYVLPESIPAFVNVRNEMSLTGNRFLVVDIGGTTTDVAIITSDNQIERSRSFNLGALSQLDKFSLAVCNRCNISEITDALALDGLLSGSMFGVDVSDLASSIKSEFSTLIDESINKISDPRLFDAVILTGGGSSIVTLNYSNAVSSSTPQFDNALGAQYMVNQ